MGVPKFFRWMSERYPAISQLIAENRIPEFDCLYLDMNGIIHNCTHSDSDSATFRMTEDNMFIKIFNYIEHLFGKIQPKHLFFMAIDGVAPRAKMNQQRARRFRTALDVEKAREKAIKEGVEMPTEDAFDSNCITPGTEFMAKLTRQLKYFISKKVSEDSDWQGVEIVLSGHEVPGEGEHKIMEYIRKAKAQPGYNSNIRHCLYGLDADLIMLGLLSHDPHFCLLREEVTFGRQSRQKSKELEHQNFYLMQLCIVREYLELEFQELKAPAALSFPFDMERVIDDFILMAFFVGNDFLPNLPNLHINEGALALMFKVYKSVLPKAGGYINDLGVIRLDRLALLLDELSDVEYHFFELENQDAAWLKGKRMEKVDVMDKGLVKGKKTGPTTLTSPQKDLFRKIKKFIHRSTQKKPSQTASLDLPSSLNAADRKFVQELANDLGLEWKTVESEEGDRHMQLSTPMKRSHNNESADDSDIEEESQIAVNRVLKKYEAAKVVDVSAEEAKQQMDQKYEVKFRSWKDKYYRGKFEWGLDNEVEMRKLTENYVQGLQWVLFYYYRGVASWPWFYRYHYSPMISGKWNHPKRTLELMLIAVLDIKKGLGADLNFQLGQPFRPYQQLMGVLPDRSKKIVPSIYHDLMTNPASPIIDFYPRDFELDMNGKKMEWEAVVKIPFIDERRLLAAMGPRDQQLTPAEKERNEFGVSLKFTYSQNVQYTYPSSLVGVFPDIPYCHCVENVFDLPTIEGLDVYVGLVHGVKLGRSALAGFPSLKTLDHNGALGVHGVNVFQADSRNESMVITLAHKDSETKIDAAMARLGKKVHVGYPFLSEAKVVRVSDELFTYILQPSGLGPPQAIPHGPQEIEMWHKKAEGIERVYSKRLGVLIGPIETLVHVETLKGLKKTDEGATIKEYAHIDGIETDYATQTVVDEVISEDPRFLEQAALPIQDEFSIGTRAFFLGEFNYGRPLEVFGHQHNRANVWVSILQNKIPEFGRQIAAEADRLSPYTPSFAVAKMLNLNGLVLSKITASFQVELNEQRINLGLNLKFEAKKQKVLGYSRRGDNGWEFSPKAVDLIRQYMMKFPAFIAHIQQNTQGNVYRAEDIYPKEEAKEKIKEIQEWLKEIESKSFERVPLDAAQLDSSIVQRIERAADDAVRANPLGSVTNKKVNGTPRNALLRPGDAEHRLNNQHFTLGDRVVYVQDSGKVPIATQGTVVGINRTSGTTLLDIIFDVTFMSGTSLEGRCSPFRGSTVPKYTVLNTTDRQVTAGSRAAETYRPRPVNQPLTVNGYGAPTGPNGQGQMVPAQAPGLLRGSFRGALVGQKSSPRGGFSGRGRGGNEIDGSRGSPQRDLPFRGPPRPQANEVNGHARDGAASRTGSRGGLSSLGMKGSNGPSVRNNISFRPQSYTNVPPPASLDARGRGRGERSYRNPRGQSDSNRARGSVRRLSTEAVS